MDASQTGPQGALTPAVFHILMALADGEKHGYAIMKDVQTVTEGKLTLGPGTLYGTIKRLLEVRWIEEAADRPIAAGEDERRRYYRLTEIGETVVRTEARRLDALVETARRRRLLTSFEGGC